MMSKKRRLMLLASMVLVLLSVISVTVFAEAEDVAAPASPFYMTFWSLLPPIIAIALALITKEVYTSLFV